MAVLMARFLIDDYGMHYYARAQNVVRRIRGAYDHARCDEVDLLVMPTSPTKAHRLPGPNGTREDLLAPGFAPITNTAPFNATGHPAMTVPVGSLRRPASRDDDRRAARTSRRPSTAWRTPSSRRGDWRTA